MSNSEIAKMLIKSRARVPIDKCGAGLAAEIISDRWTLLILREAFYGVKRFNDFLDCLDIPRSVLTSRLKSLVEHSILDREPYQEAGARTRNGYKLTKKGADLGIMFLAIMEWGDTYMQNGQPAVDVVDMRNGKHVKVGIVDEAQETIKLSDLGVKWR